MVLPKRLGIVPLAFAGAACGTDRAVAVVGVGPGVSTQTGRKLYDVGGPNIGDLANLDHTLDPLRSAGLL